MCCLVLRLLNRGEDVLAQPFAADGASVTLDIGVLLGPAVRSEVKAKRPRRSCSQLWVVKFFVILRHVYNHQRTAP